MSEVVDKKKLLEWIDGMTASNNGHVPGVAIWILIRKIESGELDPDPVKDFLCVNCGETVTIEDHDDHIRCEPDFIHYPKPMQFDDRPTTCFCGTITEYYRLNWNEVTCPGCLAHKPNLLEEGLKQCFPGVKFVTSGEKK
jgi:hypothetical protein